MHDIIAAKFINYLIENSHLNVSELTTVTPNYENVTSFTISTQLEMKECGAYGVVNNRRQ